MKGSRGVWGFGVLGLFAFGFWDFGLLVALGILGLLGFGLLGLLVVRGLLGFRAFGGGGVV